MRRSRILALTAAVVGVVSPRPVALASAGSADYVVTTPSGLYEAPPGNAAPIGFTSQSQGVPVALPFPFPYWGVPYASAWATPTGYACFGVSSTQGAQSGQASNGLMANVVPANNWDGMCAPHWDNIYYGTVYAWTAGSAPDRRFILSWENFTYSPSTAEHLYFQIKLFEGTGKIQFAYRPDTIPSTWISNHYNCGLVAPGADPRWTAATTDNNVQAGHPATDFEFSPRRVHYTGTLLFDRPVPSASGIPATPTADVPLGGVRLELRFADGSVNSSTYTAADGSFDLPGFAGPAAAAAEIWAVASSVSCVVTDPSLSAPAAVRVASGLSFTTDADVGTLRVTAAADSSATFRAPAAIASAIQRVYAWAAPLTGDPIPRLSVSYDASSTAPTRYLAGPPASLRVAGPSAANPDMWDDPVIMRTYARHVIASIAAPPTVGFDDRFDAVTDDENAFATAFGCYAWAAVTGGRVFVDGTGATTATTIDLEDPRPVSPKGTAVAAWIAAALYDLVDPANEPWDWIDGTGAAAAVPFQTVDALAAPPTLDRFYREWALQRDALGLSRVLIHHGLAADDASEPNDSAAEATPLGPPGTRRDGLTLEIHNEDWFAVSASDPVADLVVEANYPSIPATPVVLFEAYDALGTLLAGRTDAGGAGPIALDLGARPAGTYKLRMRHVSGDLVPTYSVQASDAMVLDQRLFKSWTLGRPYVDDVPLRGGIRPYAIMVQPSAGGIPGVGVNPVLLVASGTPTQAATYDFTLVAQDAGSPMHVVVSSQHVVIAPSVTLPMAEFLGVAADKPADFALPRTGGTAPLAFSLDAGAPPPGLTFDAATFRLTGTAAAPGSAKATFSAVDVAGSSDQRAATVVACAPLVGKATPVDLAAGDCACGLYVDAVKGSALTFAVSTARGSPKRALRAALVGSDGADVAGAALRGGTGKASATKAIAPFSGRFFFVAASSAGDVAHLLGSVASKPPTKGKGVVKPLAAGATFDVEIGLLAGAALTFKATPDAKSGLALTVVGLVDPDGLPASFGTQTAKRGATTFVGTPAQSGTWTIRVRATGSTSGSATYSYALKEPKGAAYSAD